MRIRKITSIILAVLMLLMVFAPNVMATEAAKTSENVLSNESINPDTLDVDTDELYSVMNRGEAIIQSGEFTEESLEIFNTAYSKAMTAVFYGQSQEEVDKAKADLEAAIDGLVPLNQNNSNTTSPTDSNEVYYCLLGDVNGDSKVNIRDTTAIQKHIANPVPLTETGISAADTNGDGVVNIKDSTEVQKHLAGFSVNGSIGKENEFSSTPAATVNTTEASSSVAEAITTDVPENTESSTEVTTVTQPIADTIPTEVINTSGSTDATEATQSAYNEVSFTVAEEFRINGYGSAKTELHLITSRAQMEAVIAKVQGSEYGSLYTTPTINEKYNDAFFENNSLIISLNVVGGSCCTQIIDSITVDGEILTVHRTIYKPEIVLADMNYQYVLIEVGASDTENVKSLEDSTTVAHKGEDITHPADKTPTGKTITVYFSNSQYWSDVNIHFWGGEYSTSWPGNEMEFVEHNIYGQDVFKYTIPADTTGIVFNEGVNMAQTVDVVTGISDGYGFYPTETADGKWEVESYIYEYKETDTTPVITETSDTVTLPTIPDTTAPDEDILEKDEIPFNVVEQCRVQGYGLCETELYLIRTVAEFETVLSKIEGETDGFLYTKPVIDEKYNDTYFMSNSLIVSLNVVGGSCCTQTVDSITVENDTLTVHRTLYKPQNVLCDMNYQYVLIEVNNADINGVTAIENHNTYITVEH